MIQMMTAMIISIETSRITEALAKLTFVFLSFLIGLLYKFFTSSVNTPYTLTSYSIVFAEMFFPLFLFKVYRKSNSCNAMRNAIIMIYGLLAIVFINTYVAFLTDADIVHKITNLNDESYSSTLYNINIMSMDHAYAIVPLIFSLMLFFDYKRNVIARIIMLAAIIFCIFLTFICQFSSVIFIFLICFVYYRFNKSGSIFKWVLIIALIVGYLLLPTLLKSISDSLESANMSERFREVANFLGEGDMSGYNLSGRLNLYKDGIMAFLKSPLIGNYDLGFNPHSTFIQFAADIGILGLSALIIMLHMARKEIERSIDKKYLHGFRAGYLSFILTGCINPIIAFPVMSATVFLLIPLTISVLSKK